MQCGRIFWHQIAGPSSDGTRYDAPTSMGMHQSRCHLHYNTTRLHYHICFVHSSLHTLGLKHLAKLYDYDVKTNFLFKLPNLWDIPMMNQHHRVSGRSTFMSLRNYSVLTSRRLNVTDVSSSEYLSIFVMENVLLPIWILESDEYQTLEVPVMLCTLWCLILLCAGPSSDGINVHNCQCIHQWR